MICTEGTFGLNIVILIVFEMYYSAEMLSQRGFPLELQGCLVYALMFLYAYMFISLRGDVTASE